MQKQEFINSLKSNKLTVFLSEEGFGHLKPFLCSILNNEVFKLDCDRSQKMGVFYQFLLIDTETFENERKDLIALTKNKIIAENLIGLVAYLSQTQKLPYLLIEYPEQNLHPIKQRKLTRILARLINKGIKLILLTHSSDIIREFNNLIMLNKHQDKTPFKEKYGYLENEGLDSSYIKAYEIIGNKIVEAEIINEGIIASVLDGSIITANTISDDLYWSLEIEDEND